MNSKSILTDLSLWSDSVAKSRCLDVVCVCVFVCAIAENPLFGGLKILAEECNANTDFFVFFAVSMIFLCFDSLLYITGELAGGEGL